MNRKYNRRKNFECLQKDCIICPSLSYHVPFFHSVDTFISDLCRPGSDGFRERATFIKKVPHPEYPFKVTWLCRETKLSLVHKVQFVKSKFLSHELHTTITLYLYSGAAHTFKNGSPKPSNNSFLQHSIVYALRKFVP